MQGILLNNDFKTIIEPIRDTNGLIVQGMKIGNIDYQRCHMIIVLNKGEIKEYPTVGFGIDAKLKQPVNENQFKVDMEKELDSDGMISEVVIKNGNVLDFEVNIK